MIKFLTRGDYIWSGYTIPAGWVIMVVNSALHLNPATFKDPLEFNPWRWKVYMLFHNETKLNAKYPQNLHLLMLDEKRRTSIRMLFLRTWCLSVEEGDNVQDQNSLNCSWQSSFTNWSPNIGKFYYFLLFFWVKMGIKDPKKLY
jgi:hypothetical protein